jgi:Flp pilus assembly protein TadD
MPHLRNGLFRVGRYLVLGALLFVCVACVSQKNTRQEVDQQVGGAAAKAQQARHRQHAELLAVSMKLIEAHKPAEAIDGPLQTLINEFENSFNKHGMTYYCARGQAETLLYALEAANAKQDALVLDTAWSDTYRLKGYALIDLGRIADAQVALKKAVALSPENSFYLSELAYTYQIQNKLAKALDIYTHAEEAAKTFSPENVKTIELTRALRGQGFVLSDMNRLDEAESRYRACLRLNPEDEKAKHELKYIAELRKR